MNLPLILPLCQSERPFAELFSFSFSVFPTKARDDGKIEFLLVPGEQVSPMLQPTRKRETDTCCGRGQIL